METVLRIQGHRLSGGNPISNSRRGGLAMADGTGNVRLNPCDQIAAEAYNDMLAAHPNCCTLQLPTYDLARGNVFFACDP